MKTKEGAMRIFEALSSVDEELLLRSEGEQKVVSFWKYAKVMAACICFVVVGAVAINGSRLVSTENLSTDSAAPAAAEEKILAAEDFKAEGVEEAAAETADRAPAEMMDEGISVETATSDANMEADKQKYAVAESGSEIATGNNEPSTMLSLEELRLVERFGEYVPTEVPAGYVFAEGSESAAGDSISARWENGMDTITIVISEYEKNEENEARIAEISQPETYDVHLYEIPYGETVPDEYWAVFNNPIFREEDLSREVIRARMKSVSDMGDTNTPRGCFAVLYDNGVYVSFNGRGDAESIWKMFESVGNE